MTKSVAYCLLLTIPMALPQVSVAQQSTPGTPSPQYSVERDAPPSAPPSSEQIKQLLAFKLPFPWTVQTLEIEASQNVGSPSAPVFKQRFEAQVSLKEALYELVTLDPYASDQPRDSKRIVRSVAEAGKQHTLIGVATAVYLNGQYNVFFEFVNRPRYSGRPLNEFGGNVLVKGSPEEVAYTAEREKRRKEEKAAHKEHHYEEYEEREAEAREKAAEEARRRAAEAEEARKTVTEQ